MKHEVPIKLHPTAFAAFGPDLVTSDVVALMELIKNCYDAFAYNVSVSFRSYPTPIIEIVDDGIGMTRDTIENVWAVVATPYKRTHPTITRNKRVRRVSGNKGMGRFSSARLGNTVDIYTKHEGDGYIHAHINWKEILNLDSVSECKITLEETNPSAISSVTGTRIVITDLNSEWTQSDYDELVENLRRIMSPFDDVSDFNVNISIQQEGVTETQPYAIEAPDFVKSPVYCIKASADERGNVYWEYHYDNRKSKKNRSITGSISWEDIFNNQFSDISSSKKKNISNDAATCGPFSVEIRAWDLDADSIGDISEVFNIKKSSIRDTLRTYKGISIYRDGILVLPKSEASRDWIGLDARRISEVGKRMSTSQMLGIIRIGADENPEIRDTTDREKLVDTKETVEFYAIIRSIVSQLENLRDMDRTKKRKEPSIVDVLAPLSPDRLVIKAKDAVEKGKSADEILKIVQEYESESKAQFEDVRKRLYYYGQVATAGSMASFILHEIRGGLTSVKRFLNSIVTIRQHFDEKSEKYYPIAIKSHERMLMVASSFAPLYSTNFKNQRHTSNLKNEISSSIHMLDEKLEKEKITVIYDSIPGDATICLHPGEIQTVLVNLIDNAIYWIKQKGHSEQKIVISAHEKTPNRMTISVSDTGKGVPFEYAEKIFEPGVTAKANGVGMGLVIVAEVLARHDGKIALQIPSDLGGATFVFDVPIA